MNFQCLANTKNIHQDVLIITVPWVDTNMPLMAPAVLKPAIEKTGHSCLAVDLNAEVHHWVSNHPQKGKLIDFFFDGRLDPELEVEVNDFFESTVKQILTWSPKWVGFSTFTFLCQHSLQWLCYFLRKHDPAIKIIIGGPGCLPTIAGSSTFVSRLRKMDLIDFHIRGDGELAIQELLSGNQSYEGINSNAWQEMTREELEQLPFPDYSNYDLTLYNKQAIPIIGSRGCVRQCTFCDYIQNWKKFQWRSADSIFDEMMHSVNVHGITKFKFQDSLVNGNSKEFNKLMEMMADYNQSHAQQLEWAGFYIFREITSKTDHEWEMIAKSKTKYIEVGIESFSQHIRYAMGKKFSNESIIYHLEKAKQHGITCFSMMIVGYINETQQDIDYTKQWLRDNTRFKDNIIFHWGTGLAIFDQTYLHQNKDVLGIKMIGEQPHEWTSDSAGTTPAQRAQWTRELIALSKELGYGLSDTQFDAHFLLEKNL